MIRPASGAGRGAPTRRAVLAAPLVVAAACGGANVWTSSRAQHGDPVEWSGATQAGIVRPRPPQRRAHVLVLRDDGDPADLSGRLSSLGSFIGRLAGDRDDRLTVTVGVGLDATTASTGAPMPDLPTFARDLTSGASGGDLLVQVCGDDPRGVDDVVRSLLRWLTDRGFVGHWEQAGFRRTPDDRGVARDVLGFRDGVTLPSTSAELDRGVWIEPPGSTSPWAGATFAVVRRLRVDSAGFLALDVGDREAIIGRRQDSGAPLSGGAADDPVDLDARRPDGRPLVSSSAHVRRAHPAPLGHPLLLRRSYSYRNGDGDEGVLFISFQRALDVFVDTQHHLDAGDALMEYVTATASAAFLVLPGSGPDRPLGHPLEALGGG